jgi:hypothetical protein
LKDALLKIADLSFLLSSLVLPVSSFGYATDILRTVYTVIWSHLQDSHLLNYFLDKVLKTYFLINV